MSYGDELLESSRLRESYQLRARFAALDSEERRNVFAYLARECPEQVAEALRRYEPDPGERPRAGGGSGG